MGRPTWGVCRVRVHGDPRLCCMDLIRHFSPDLPSEALTDWQWLTELAGKRPLATSAFGDVFLQGDDGVWFLDTVEGKLSREWDSPGSLHAQLNTAAGQDRYLMAGPAVAASNTVLGPRPLHGPFLQIPPLLLGVCRAPNNQCTPPQSPPVPD